MTVKEILDKARGEVGTQENPPGSNRVKYNDWFYGHNVWGDSYPWCAVFISWLFWTSGAQDLIHNVHSYYSGDFLKAGREHGEEINNMEGQPGDLIIFDWGDGGITDHIGIIEKTLAPGRYQTIEGNEKNMVTRMIRDVRDSKIWIIRPKYSDEGGEKEMAIITTTGTYFAPVLSPLDGEIWIKIYNGGKKETLVHVGCVTNDKSLEDTVYPGKTWILNGAVLGFKKGEFDDSPIVITSQRDVSVTIKQG